MYKNEINERYKGKEVQAFEVGWEKATQHFFDNVLMMAKEDKRLNLTDKQMFELEMILRRIDHSLEETLRYGLGLEDEE